MPWIVFASKHEISFQVHVHGGDFSWSPISEFGLRDILVTERKWEVQDKSWAELKFAFLSFVFLKCFQSKRLTRRRTMWLSKRGKLAFACMRSAITRDKVQEVVTGFWSSSWLSLLCQPANYSVRSEANKKKSINEVHVAWFMMQLFWGHKRFLKPTGDRPSKRETTAFQSTIVSVAVQL